MPGHDRIRRRMLELLPALGFARALGAAPQRVFGSEGKLPRPDAATAPLEGFVTSERLNPLTKLPAESSSVHFGIHAVVLASPVAVPQAGRPAPYTEAGRVDLVEYEPGGHTTPHAHAAAEQAFYVLSGRARFEIGAVEREVGPGDLVFAPRDVKHGYRVLGGAPFRFLQMEWKVDRRGR